MLVNSPLKNNIKGNLFGNTYIPPKLIPLQRTRIEVHKEMAKYERHSDREDSGRSCKRLGDKTQIEAVNRRSLHRQLQ